MLPRIDGPEFLAILIVYITALILFFGIGTLILTRSDKRKEADKRRQKEGQS
jgi:hypothetical protein